MGKKKRIEVFQGAFVPKRDDVERMRASRKSAAKRKEQTNEKKC